ncbi:MAG: hypothetical protein Q4F13_09085 [Pseudomonadota bacterium]|nr:hypothetical protein [Pseudomonadota bacterium]
MDKKLLSREMKSARHSLALSLAQRARADYGHHMCAPGAPFMARFYPCHAFRPSGAACRCKSAEKN